MLRFQAKPACRQGVSLHRISSSEVLWKMALEGRAPIAMGRKWKLGDERGLSCKNCTYICSENAWFREGSLNTLRFSFLVQDKRALKMRRRSTPSTGESANRRASQRSMLKRDPRLERNLCANALCICYARRCFDSGPLPGTTQRFNAHDTTIPTTWKHFGG